MVSPTSGQRGFFFSSASSYGPEHNKQHRQHATLDTFFKAGIAWAAKRALFGCNNTAAESWGQLRAPHFWCKAAECFSKTRARAEEHPFTGNALREPLHNDNSQPEGRKRPQKELSSGAEEGEQKGTKMKIHHSHKATRPLTYKQVHILLPLIWGSWLVRYRDSGGVSSYQ